MMNNPEAGQPIKAVKYIFAIVAVMAALYHFIFTQIFIGSPEQHSNNHLFFSLLLVGLAKLQTGRRPYLWVMFIVASLICTGYVALNFDELVMELGSPSLTTEVIGWAFLLVVFIATFLEFGIILPAIAIASIIYAFVSPYLPQPFTGPEISHQRIVSFLSIGVGYGGGIYGQLLTVSANYIFLFILYGGLLGATKATMFFEQMGNWVGARFKGGAALTAVVGSGLVGTITGNPAANVAITGVFTIPAMKKEGRHPEEAAAFEAVASSGGSIMPPVMGASAFLMAAMLGIPYIQVCGMALIGALLYYFVCGMQAEITGRKQNVHPSGRADYHKLIVSAPVFLIPLFILTYMMIIGRTPMFSIFWSTVSLILVSLIRKETRPSWSGLLNGVKEGCLGGAKIGVTCACLGPIATVFTMTLLGVKIPGIVADLSGGNLIIGLILGAAVTVLLGCGLTGPAVFVICSLIVVPALVQLGLSREVAYFFVLYFHASAPITPPVALASLVAAKIAHADYMKTCIRSVKLGMVIYIFPFLMVTCPALILVSPSWLLIFDIMAATTGLAATAILLNNYYLFKLRYYDIALCVTSIIGTFGYIFTGGNYILLILGMLAFSLLNIVQVKRRGERLLHL